MKIDSEFCSDIENGAHEAATAIIPTKSKELYESAYNSFIDWCKLKNTDSVVEKVLTAYFNEKSKGINGAKGLSAYVSLLAFIKRKNIGHKPKQSDILNRANFEKFIVEVDEQNNLLLKVAFIIGIGGACRKIEMLKLTTDEVFDNGDHVLVSIVDTKNYEPRQFMVTAGSVNQVDLLAILRRYIALRPKNVSHNRFFVGYRSGKCINQPVGINSFASMPQKIATFLGLTNIKSFTGHCFRRSWATILAEAEAGMTCIKRTGGWKSVKVVERYIQNTLTSKRKAAQTIFGKDEPSTSKKLVTNESVNAESSSFGKDELNTSKKLVTNESVNAESSSEATFEVISFTSSQVNEMSLSVVTPKVNANPPVLSNPIPAVPANIAEKKTNRSVKRDVDVLICVIKNSHEMRALKAQAALCFEEYCEPDEFCYMAAMFDPRYKSLKFAPPETREKAIDMLERLVALELDESMKVAEEM
ncbi:hypothetical protein Bhyg_12017 [Pseudolycoriella hygida]|uniref:Tyr recombinase domain-containing protein n=1 Tax=Pseudolycoriella hygida TaxID=35572 RepID=A0A9Q0MXX7_9DIPT|nr:hypothetical protein Bhyg_12017 [Pseudolycoriella hygida]